MNGPTMRVRAEGKARRTAKEIEALGRKALESAKQKVRELFGELIEEQ